MQWLFLWRSETVAGSTFRDVGEALHDFRSREALLVWFACPDRARRVRGSGRYFMKKVQRAKKTGGEVLAMNEIFEKNPNTVRNGRSKGSEHAEQGPFAGCKRIKSAGEELRHLASLPQPLGPAQHVQGVP